MKEMPPANLLLASYQIEIREPIKNVLAEFVR